MDRIGRKRELPAETVPILYIVTYLPFRYKEERMKLFMKTAMRYRIPIKKACRSLSALFLAACLTVCLSLPAQAEGFDFGWDQDEQNPEGPHCKSIIMLNLDTDTVVYALNPDERLSMASLTKIMSYIVAYETIPDIENTVITVPQSVADDLEGTGSSLAGIAVGEELTGLQLLYLMMVPSGNDAALTLAEYVDSLHAQGLIAPKEEGKPEDPQAAQGGGESAPGSGQAQADDPQAAPQGEAAGEPEMALLAEGGDSPEDGGTEDGGEEEFTGDPAGYTPDSYFVQLMNKKAEELGCRNTHFTNPHGLYNPDHYSTARDLARIAEYAMTLPNFTDITGTFAYVKPATNVNESEETFHSTNKLLQNYMDEQSGIEYYYKSATGIKTGSHNQAGYCLAASATALGYTYVVICLGDMEGYEEGIHGEMLDARSLFRWALENLGKKTVAVPGEVLSSVNLEYAFQQDQLLLAAGESASVMLPNSVDASSIVVTVNKPESVQAPVRKGEQVGTATLSYADEVIATVPLVAAESVSRSDLLASWEQGKSLLSSPWFVVIIAVIVALIVVYFILMVMYRRKQRMLRRVRKFRDM